MQMLLYPFEEKFHVPSLFIEFCDGESLVSQMVGDETVDISRGKVFIDYHAEFLWVLLLGVLLGKPDDLIADNTSLLINRHGIDNLISHIILSSCHKECAILVDDIEESAEVHIPLVYQIDSSHLDTDFIQGVNIVNRCFGQKHEYWEIASQIKLGMQFNATLLLSEFCPRAEFETETDGTAVERIDHVVNVKPEAILRIERAHLFDKDLPQFRIDMPISELIRLSQSIAGNGIANATVIELMGIQACLYIAQTILIGILSQAHDQQLVIAGEVSHPVIASVLGNNIIEFPTRYELHNLCEYYLSEIHVTRFFDGNCKVSQFKSCTRNIESKSFYFNNLYLNRLILTGH